MDCRASWRVEYSGYSNKCQRLQSNLHNRWRIGDTTYAYANTYTYAYAYANAYTNT
jgi:hypothetical protein